MNSSPPAPLAFWPRIAPALLLMFAAPLCAEVLPGATRFSSIFVFPIEVFVWGGGALLIRAAVRRSRLGRLNLLLLSVGLAVAEECLIQQTSLAPLVIQLKGQVYARAFGVNYVYLLWALVYEAVLVVVLPVALVELIFPARRDQVWVSRAGLAVVAPWFLLGSFLAWFTWTQIARPKVFHLPVYPMPPAAVLISSLAIAGLVFIALGPGRNAAARPSSPLDSPAPWLLGVLGALWATIWYALVLLAFGIAPAVPPLLPVGVGLIVAAVMVLLVPRWAGSARWQARHCFGIIFGTMLGSMLVGFVGFQGAPLPDIVFKAVTNLVAVILLVMLGRNVWRRSAPTETGSVTAR